MPKMDVIPILPKQKSEKEVTSTLPHDEVDKFLYRKHAKFIFVL